MSMMGRVVLYLFAGACGLGATACGSSSQAGDGGSDAGADASGDGAAPSWGASGLAGNVISVVAVDPKSPSTIFAGTSAASAMVGFFRSQDSGHTWSPVAGGLPAQSAQSIAISPTQNIVIASVGIATYRSTDGGNTWTESGNDPGALYNMLFHPSGTQVWTATAQRGLYTSTDGASWTNITSTGLPPLNTVDLGPLAHDGSKLYLGTGGQSVYVSADGGLTFTGPGAGIPQAFADSINALAASPARPGVAFALTLNDGLYRSNDSGANWSKVTVGNSTRRSGLIIDRRASSTFYVSLDETQGGPGGLARSRDDGVTWSPFGPPGKPVSVIDESPTDGTIWAGTIGDGIWRFGL